MSLGLLVFSAYMVFCVGAGFSQCTNCSSDSAEEPCVQISLRLAAQSIAIASLQGNSCFGSLSLLHLPRFCCRSDYNLFLICADGLA